MTAPSPYRAKAEELKRMVMSCDRMECQCADKITRALEEAVEVSLKANQVVYEQNQDNWRRMVEAAKAAQREMDAKIADDVYSDGLGALAGDEPKEVGRKIARRIRESK
jgi:hypothetical protein